MDEKDLLQQLRAAFREESNERLVALSVQLVDLENGTLSKAEQAAALEAVFRELHSLKGAARAADFSTIERLCQESETILAAVKGGQLPVSAPLFDALHEVIEVIKRLNEAHFLGLSTDFAPEIAAITAVSGKLQALEKIDRLRPEDKAEGTEISAGERQRLSPPARVGTEQGTAGAESRPAPPVAQAQSAADTMRVAKEKLDGLLLQAEELASLKQVSGHQRLLLDSISRKVALWRRRMQGIAADLRLLRHEENGPQQTAAAGECRSAKALAGIIDFFDWQQTLVQELDGEVKEMSRSAKRQHYFLEQGVNGLLDDMKKVIMLPFATACESLPAMARNIARQYGKQVHLSLAGGDTELDRRILDALKDPLMHLVRNAVDHGMEEPAARTAAGKQTVATIRVAAEDREDGTVNILVADDGRGVDLPRVRRLMDKEAKLSGAEDEVDVLRYLFHSGVTTSPTVTDISGRGIGLAIVKERVESLGGQVRVESEAGKGTSFIMRLPVTLASFRGVLVDAGGGLFVIPSAQIQAVLRLRQDAIRTVENRATISQAGEVLALVDLAVVLGISHRLRRQEGDFIHAVVLTTPRRRIAFRVHRVLDEQEFLVKSLGKQLNRVRNIAGATILGSGLLAPVLNVQDLLAAAVGTNATAAALQVSGREMPARRTVLLVEDSITSRMLLKNILAGAGYEVVTAVDGMDALAQLGSAQVDLVVSDIEMPKMDGFALTARIRAESRLADLPVILVTGLESREDREKGIEAGANAYLVKSGFDQNNLLEIAARLLG